MEKSCITFNLIENEEAKTLSIGFTHEGVPTEVKYIFLKSEDDFDKKVIKYLALSSISCLITNQKNNA